MFIIGGILALLFSIGLIALITISVVKIASNPKQENSTSKFNLLTFVKGLNLKKQYPSILYFCHFIGIRVFLAVTLCFSAYLGKGTIVIWMVIFGMQMICFTVHCFMIYGKLIHNIMVLIREVQIGFVIAYIGLIQLFDQTTEVQK